MNKQEEITRLKLKLIAQLNNLRYSELTGEEKGIFSNYPPDLQSKLKRLHAEIDAGKTTTKNITPVQKNLIETVLLTHYLWYICNRQMKVEGSLIKRGNYVLARMSESFVENRNKFVNSSSFDEWFRNRCHYDDTGEKVKFYFVVPEEKEIFTARFMGKSVPAMYRLLSFLRCKDIFSVFLAGEKGAEKSKLFKVFKDLDENSYFSKEHKNADKEFGDFFNKKKSGEEIFEPRKKDKWNYEQRRYLSKRLWCCLIDYLMRGNGFIPLIKTVIGQSAFNDLQESVDDVELPGDTHNDSKAFAECVWGEEALKGWERKGKKLPAPKIRSSRFVRYQYDKCRKTGGFPGWRPIDYDITFTYTQTSAMRCDEKKKTECTFCPIGSKFRYDDWNKLCHKEKGKDCQYVKKALDKEYKCPGKANCQILRLVNKIHPQQ